MVETVMNLFKTVFSNCLVWFWNLLLSIDGLDWVLAALIFVAVVSLLLMPLRGGRSIDASPLKDFSVNVTYNRRRPSPWRGRVRQHERISNRGTPQIDSGVKQLGTGGYKVK